MPVKEGWWQHRILFSFNATFQGIVATPLAVWLPKPSQNAVNVCIYFLHTYFKQESETKNVLPHKKWQGSIVTSIGAHMVFILVSEYYLKVKTLCMWFQHLECSQSTPQWYHSEVTAHCHGEYKSLETRIRAEPVCWQFAELKMLSIFLS